MARNKRNENEDSAPTQPREATEDKPRPQFPQPHPSARTPFGMHPEAVAESLGRGRRRRRGFRDDN